MKWNTKWNTLIVTNGTYRIIHRGHLDLFEKASQMGSLCIFVDSKERVAQIKPGAYCLDDFTRLELLEYFCDADMSPKIFSSEEELKEKIKDLWTSFTCYKEPKGVKCNLIYVKGGDYKAEDLTLKSFIEELGGEVVIIPFLEGYSTSAIIKEIKEKNLI